MGWLFGRKLNDVIHPTRTFRVHGVKFTIRKLTPMDYLSGSRAVSQIYDTFKSAGTLENVEIRQSQLQQLRANYADTFLAAVVSPALKRKAEDPATGTPVEHLMTDWDFANELYQRILEFTYGKKKIQSLVSSKIAALNSTPSPSVTASSPAK